MRRDEVWICIHRIGFDNVMHEAGDKVKIRELDYFKNYNFKQEKHPHAYRVYLKDLHDEPKGWMMDWIFLRFFERERNESWTDSESQEQFGQESKDYRNQEVHDMLYALR